MTFNARIRRLEGKVAQVPEVSYADYVLAAHDPEARTRLVEGLRSGALIDRKGVGEMILAAARRGRS